MTKNAHRMHRHGRQAGFSLLELSIVIMVIAMIAGSGLMMGRSAIQSAQTVATQNRLSEIETALMAYRLAHDRLPCPADIAFASNNANYGIESGTPGDCTDGTPAASYSVEIDGSTVVEGTVPVRTLGLPDDMMYDGWGRRIVYAVWAPITGERAFLDYGISTNCGKITVNNAGGANRTTNGLYALLSLGENGHFGYNKAGAQLNAGITNAEEQLNCHCDENADEIGYTAVYVQRDMLEAQGNPLAGFDDIVRYKERWQMQNINDAHNPDGNLTCPAGGGGGTGAGTRVRIGGDSDTFGYSVASGDVDHDGYDDIIVGATYNGVATDPGRAYIIFGKNSPLSADTISNMVAGGTAVRIDGDGSGGKFGYSVAAGDMNNDGYDDVAVGAPDVDWIGTKNGVVYVIFGKARGAWPSVTSVDSPDGSTVAGVAGDASDDHLGMSLAFANLNNDAYEDLIIGMPKQNSQVGGATVVFGPNGGNWPGEAVFTNIFLAGDGEGFRFLPDSGDTESCGDGVGGGDINGDDIDDLIIGCSGIYNSTVGAQTGGAHVVFGKSSGWSASVASSSLDGTNGFSIISSTSSDGLGASVAIGDITGEGISDIVLGAPFAMRSAWNGMLIAIFGKSTAFSHPFYIADITDPLDNGIEIYEDTSQAAASYLGRSLALGKVSGQASRSDIVIGANGYNYSGTSEDGGVHVAFGLAKDQWGATPIGISAFNNGTKGFTVASDAGGEGLGFSVATGDLNGDGKDDMIMGAPYYTATGGAIYIYYGQQTSSWTTPILSSQF